MRLCKQTYFIKMCTQNIIIFSRNVTPLIDANEECASFLCPKTYEERMLSALPFFVKKLLFSISLINSLTTFAADITA